MELIVISDGVFPNEELNPDSPAHQTPDQVSGLYFSQFIRFCQYLMFALAGIGNVLAQRIYQFFAVMFANYKPLIPWIILLFLPCRANTAWPSADDCQGCQGWCWAIGTPIPQTATCRAAQVQWSSESRGRGGGWPQNGKVSALQRGLWPCEDAVHHRNLDPVGQYSQDW